MQSSLPNVAIGCLLAYSLQHIAYRFLHLRAILPCYHRPKGCCTGVKRAAYGIQHYLRTMKAISVFCGSSFGNDDVFTEQTALLGKTLAEQNMTLVYGGAKVGLMGVLANSALAAGGKVIGVLPRFLRTKEIEHTGLSELILVDSLHERKAKMNTLCDGIIALPGGFGTMEEFFEILTWGQLGLHTKPTGMLNVKGFYNPLLTLVQQMVTSGFLKPANQQMLLVNSNVETLLNAMANYVAPEVTKWITNETT
jgi:uncharacterized protein (TIGR00730 family)